MSREGRSFSVSYGFIYPIAKAVVLVGVMNLRRLGVSQVGEAIRRAAYRVGGCRSRPNET